MEYQKFWKISKNLQKNTLETVTNLNDKQISKESCKSPEERKKDYW